MHRNQKIETTKILISETQINAILCVPPLLNRHIKLGFLKMPGYTWVHLLLLHGASLASDSLVYHKDGWGREYSVTATNRPGWDQSMDAFSLKHKWLAHINVPHKTPFSSTSHLLWWHFLLLLLKCHLLWWQTALTHTHTHTERILVSSLLNMPAPWLFMYENHFGRKHSEQNLALQCDNVCKQLIRMHPSTVLCYQSNSWFISSELFTQT